MKEITITITDTQDLGLQYVASNVQDWIENAATERARIANDEIIKIYTNRALDEGIQIPTTRELIVADAFDRGWVKAASVREAELEARLENEQTPQ